MSKKRRKKKTPDSFECGYCGEFITESADCLILAAHDAICEDCAGDLENSLDCDWDAE